METQSQSGTTEGGGLSEAERWASLVTGGSLVMFGLKQRSLRGALLAAAGGTLAYHGAKGSKSLKENIAEKAGRVLRVERTVTISNRSPAELYQFWHDFENLPRFMKHLKSVTVVDDKRSRWVTSTPLGGSVQWDAEIVKDEENSLIAWASVENSEVENSGFVRFRPAAGGLGTEVKLVLEYSPPAGIVGAAVARLFGEEAEQQVKDELRRFKMLMETGEIATTEGQTSGRASG